LQVLEDPGEVRVQQGPVAGEQEQRHGQRGQHEEVQQPVQGDQPQHVAVPERAAAQRQYHVRLARRVLGAGLAGRAQRHPRVAAQAAIPAQAVTLPGVQAILGAQPRGIGAEQFVAVQATPDQLVPKLQAVSPRTLGPRRQHQLTPALISHCPWLLPC
jgi:hypothetical protein